MTGRAGTHLGLVGMALLWGASWPAGRTLALAMPPFAGSAWRFTLAVALLLAWMLWRDGGRWPQLTRRQWFGLALAGTVGVAGYSVFFMLALARVEGARAAVVVTTNPVFTTLLAAWLFKETFNLRIALGLAFAVVGAATVLTHGAPWQVFTGAIGLGEWFLLGCIGTWVAYTLMARRLLAGIDTLVATAMSALIGTVMLWLAAVLAEGAAPSLASITSLSGPGWVSLVFLAVGATVLSYVWYFRGVAELGAGTAASYISLVPVFGVVSSAWLLGERIDASLAIGGALAIVGVVINNQARRFA
jgi:drug/metabolite transporter (DMT)-like permease